MVLNGKFSIHDNKQNERKNLPSPPWDRLANIEAREQWTMTDVEDVKEWIEEWINGTVVYITISAAWSWITNRSGDYIQICYLRKKMDR